MEVTVFWHPLPLQKIASWKQLYVSTVCKQRTRCTRCSLTSNKEDKVNTVMLQDKTRHLVVNTF